MSLLTPRGFIRIEPSAVYNGLHIVGEQIPDAYLTSPSETGFFEMTSVEDLHLGLLGEVGETVLLTLRATRRSTAMVLDYGDQKWKILRGSSAGEFFILRPENGEILYHSGRAISVDPALSSSELAAVLLAGAVISLLPADVEPAAV